MITDSNKLFNIMYNIPWNIIHNLRPECSDIPRILRGICSDDIGDRVASESMINNCIMTQGDLTEGIFYILPFLIAFIGVEPSYGKKEIYRLLD